MIQTIRLLVISLLNFSYFFSIKLQPNGPCTTYTISHNIHLYHSAEELSLSLSSLESCDLTLNTSLALKSLIIKQLYFFSFHNTFSIPKIKTNELRDKKN